MFEVEKGVSLVGLGLYVGELDVLAVADLHIGYEEALAEQGVYLPPLQVGEIKRVLREMVDACGADRLVIVGDVKHEFGDISRQEWRETLDVLRFLLEDVGVRVEVVRGNHDNYLVGVLRRLGVPFHDPYLREGRWLFFHGHRPLPVEGFSGGVERVVMGPMCWPSGVSIGQMRP